MLTIAQRIKSAFLEDEFLLVIIYGPLRYGKSALAVNILAELYNTWDPEILKKWIGFHPKAVLQRWLELEDLGKQLAFLWDDAGLWLHALDWQSPFVKSVGKYLNVAGTDWAGLIMTTPFPSYISRKIRGIPQAITMKVRKTSGDPSQKDIREAVAYRFWTAPDLKHSGVFKLFSDHYTKIMPDRFYEWYKPLRDYYAKLAKRLMREKLKTLPDLVNEEEILEAYA